MAMGFYQGEAHGLFLGEEFHHNRIRVISSQIGGIQPGLSARWSRARSDCAVAAVCGGYRGWLGHFEAGARELAVRDIIALLPVAAALQAPGIVVPAAYGMFSRKLPPFKPPRGETEDRAALLDSLRAVAREAERSGVRIFLEPLNRYEEHMLNTFAQAADLAAAVGSPAVVPMIDLFHANVEERDTAEAIRGRSRTDGRGRCPTPRPAAARDLAAGASRVAVAAGSRWMLRSSTGRTRGSTGKSAASSTGCYVSSAPRRQARPSAQDGSTSPFPRAYAAASARFATLVFSKTWLTWVATVLTLKPRS